MRFVIPRRLLYSAGVTAAALAAGAGRARAPALAGSARAAGPVSSAPAGGTPVLVTTIGKGTENVTGGEVQTLLVVKGHLRSAGTSAR